MESWSCVSLESLPLDIALQYVTAPSSIFLKTCTCRIHELEKASFLVALIVRRIFRFLPLDIAFYSSTTSCWVFIPKRTGSIVPPLDCRTASFL